MLRRKHAPHPDYDVPMIAEDDEYRYLHFDSPWAQGAMSLAEPQLLVYEYTQQMCAWLLFDEVKAESAIALLGLGAGSHYRYLQAHTEAALTAVEWSDLVIMCAEDHFFVEEDSRCRIVQADAEMWVRDTATQHQYNVVMVDLYDYSAEGPVCSSRRFYRGCANILGDKGVASFNLFGHHPSYAKNIYNIRAAFEERVLLFPETEDGNRIAIAFKGEKRVCEFSELEQRAQHLEAIYNLPLTRFLSMLVDEQENQRYLHHNKLII